MSHLANQPQGGRRMLRIRGNPGPGLVLAGVLAILTGVVLAGTGQPAGHVSEKPAGARPLLEDVTLASGVRHSHVQISEHINDIRDSLGGSACAGDFDHDGWIDLVFVAGQGGARYFGRNSWWSTHSSLVFYRNEHGHFVRVEKVADIANNTATTGCLAADLDNDTRPDLVVLTADGVRLLHNLGGFRFEPVEKFAHTGMPVWTTQAAPVDLNHDGLLDLYLTHYLRYAKNIKRFEGATGFSEQYRGNFDPTVFDGVANQLLLNKGGLQFEDVTTAYGLGQHAERSVSATWQDLDDDGLEDLLVFNDRGNPMRIYRQDKPGSLVELDAGVSLEATRFGASCQGLKGGASLFITRANGYSSLLLDFPDGIDLTGDRSRDDGMNNAGWLYLDRWGADCVDLTNDSEPSIVIADGRVEMDPYAGKMSLPQPNQCLRPGVISAAGQAVACTQDEIPSSSRSVIDLDINNDGRQDLVFTNNNDFPQVLLNRTAEAGNWITLDVGDQPELMGGSILVEAQGLRLRRRISVRPALFGNSDPRFHFGLARADTARVTISSPQGKVVTSRDVSVNSIYRVESGSIQPVEPSPRRSGLPDNYRSLPVTLLFRLLATQPLGPDEQDAITDYLAGLHGKRADSAGAFLRNHPSPGMLALYEAIIRSGNPDLEQAALDAVEKLEVENSVGLVIRALTSPDAGTVCRASHLLEHWFREEEAVIRGKYRAIPYLIRNLDEKDAVRISCAAQALSESDDITAAYALADHLQSAPVESQPDLVSAIGSLRHTGAVPRLQQLYSSSRSAPVRAACLIALNRLGDDGIDAMVNADLERPEPAGLALATMYALLTQDDGVVFPGQLVRGWMAKALKRLDGSVPDDSQVLRALVYAYRHDLLTYAELPLDTLVDHPDPAVRQAASEALAGSGRRSTARVLRLLEYPVTRPQYRVLKSAVTRLGITTESMNRLDAVQITNLVMFTPLFDAQERQAVLRRWSDLHTPELPGGLRQSFWESCYAHGAFGADDAIRQVSNAAQAVRICRIVSVLNKPRRGELKTVLANNLLSLPEDRSRADVRELAGFISSLDDRRRISREVSIALLTNAKAPDTVKSNWSLGRFHDDDYARDWILGEVAGRNNSRMLSAFLEAGGYDVLREKGDPLGLIEHGNLDSGARIELIAEYARNNGLSAVDLLGKYRL